VVTEKTSRRELFASFKEFMASEGVAEWDQAITFIQSNLGDAANMVGHYQEEEMRPRAGPAAYRLRVSVANPDSRVTALQRHRVAAERLMPKNASSGGHPTGGFLGNTLLGSGMARPGCAADRGDLVLG
jgi:hypothetical protein